MLDLLLDVSAQKVIFSILGAIAGVAIILVVYAVIMYAYFRSRKKNPSSRFRVELCFLGLAIIISAIMKFIIIAMVEGEEPGIEASGFWDYLCYCISAVYGTIGGLQFEGLAYGIGEIQSNIWGCLYFGSSVMAGLVVLSIITAKASYEVFSSIAYILPYRILGKKNVNVFVFTALTEDTLVLANSITVHYDEKERLFRNELKECRIGSKDYSELKRKIKENKYLIIFSGENIPSFTRSNPLCRDVMSNSYMYYSTVNGKDIKNCLIDRFGFSSSNVRFLSGKGSSVRLCEFHFGLDEKLKPTEEDNTAFAIKEIERTNNKMARGVDKFSFKSSELREIAKAYNGNEKEYFSYLVSGFAKSAGLMIVEHYVLTLSSINYQYYQDQRDRLISESWNSTCWSKKKEYTAILDRAYNECGIKVDNKDKFYSAIVRVMKELFSACTQLSPINESLLASKTLIINHEESLRRQIGIVEESGDNDRIFRIKNINSIWSALDASTDRNGQSHIFRAMILGFGATGQFALSEIYKHFVYTDENGVANQLYADVYDEGISNIDGIFSANHKLYLCIDKNRLDDSEGYPSDMNYDQIFDLFGATPIREYGKYIEELSDINNPTEEEKARVTSWWNRGMRLPKITFHNKSCNGLAFIKELDLKTGSELDLTRNSEPQMGNDGTIKTGYNIIVIAFGSDRANIISANAIIDEIKREYYNTPENKRVKQYIAVSIRDERNASKINWRREDMERKSNDYLNVFTFGTSEDIYSYDMILDYSKAMEPNSSYLATSKVISEIRVNEEQASIIANAPISQRQELEFNAIMSNLLVTLHDKKDDVKDVLSDDIIRKASSSEVIANEENMKCVKKALLKILPFAYYEGESDKPEISAEAFLSWLNNSPFIKESNAAAMDFRAFLNTIIQESFANAQAFTVERLLRLEHERWNRFHIANGWTYSPKKVRDVYYHNCIAPFECIPNKGSYANDYQNIASASKGLDSSDVKL